MAVVFAIRRRFVPSNSPPTRGKNILRVPTWYTRVGCGCRADELHRAKINRDGTIEFRPSEAPVRVGWACPKDHVVGPTRPIENCERTGNPYPF